MYSATLNVDYTDREIGMCVIPKGCVLLSTSLFNLHCVLFSNQNKKLYKELPVACQNPCLPQVFENKTTPNFMACRFQHTTVLNYIFTSEEVIPKKPRCLKFLFCSPFQSVTLWKGYHICFYHLFTLSFWRRVSIFMFSMLRLILYVIASFKKIPTRRATLNLIAFG